MGRGGGSGGFGGAIPQKITTNDSLVLASGDSSQGRNESSSKSEGSRRSGDTVKTNNSRSTENKALVDVNADSVEVEDAKLGGARREERLAEWISAIKQTSKAPQKEKKLKTIVHEHLDDSRQKRQLSQWLAAVQAATAEQRLDDDEKRAGDEAVPEARQEHDSKKRSAQQENESRGGSTNILRIVGLSVRRRSIASLSADDYTPLEGLLITDDEESIREYSKSSLARTERTQNILANGDEKERQLSAEDPTRRTSKRRVGFETQLASGDWRADRDLAVTVAEVDGYDSDYAAVEDSLWGMTEDEVLDLLDDLTFHATSFCAEHFLSDGDDALCFGSSPAAREIPPRRRCLPDSTGGTSASRSIVEVETTGSAEPICTYSAARTRRASTASDKKSQRRFFLLPKGFGKRSMICFDPTQPSCSDSLTDVFGSACMVATTDTAKAQASKERGSGCWGRNQLAAQRQQRDAANRSGEWHRDVERLRSIPPRIARAVTKPTSFVERGKTKSVALEGEEEGDRPFGVELQTVQVSVSPVDDDDETEWRLLPRARQCLTRSFKRTAQEETTANGGGHDATMPAQETTGRSTSPPPRGDRKNGGAGGAYNQLWTSTRPARSLQHTSSTKARQQIDVDKVNRGVGRAVAVASAASCAGRLEMDGASSARCKDEDDVLPSIVTSTSSNAKKQSSREKPSAGVYHMLHQGHASADSANETTKTDKPSIHMQSSCDLSPKALSGSSRNDYDALLVGKDGEAPTMKGNGGEVPTNLSPKHLSDESATETALKIGGGVNVEPLRKARQSFNSKNGSGDRSLLSPFEQPQERRLSERRRCEGCCAEGGNLAERPSDRATAGQTKDRVSAEDDENNSGEELSPIAIKVEGGMGGPGEALTTAAIQPLTVKRDDDSSGAVLDEEKISQGGGHDMARSSPTSPDGANKDDDTAAAGSSSGEEEDKDDGSAASLSTAGLVVQRLKSLRGTRPLIEKQPRASDGAIPMAKRRTGPSTLTKNTLLSRSVPVPSVVVSTTSSTTSSKNGGDDTIKKGTANRNGKAVQTAKSERLVGESGAATKSTLERPPLASKARSASAVSSPAGGRRNKTTKMWSKLFSSTGSVLSNSTTGSRSKSLRSLTKKKGNSQNVVAATKETFDSAAKTAVKASATSNSPSQQSVSSSTRDEKKCEASESSKQRNIPTNKPKVTRTKSAGKEQTLQQSTATAPPAEEATPGTTSNFDQPSSLDGGRAQGCSEDASASSSRAGSKRNKDKGEQRASQSGDASGTSPSEAKESQEEPEKSGDCANGSKGGDADVEEVVPSAIPSRSAGDSPQTEATNQSPEKEGGEQAEQARHPTPTNAIPVLLEHSLPLKNSKGARRAASPTTVYSVASAPGRLLTAGGSRAGSLKWSRKKSSAILKAKQSAPSKDDEEGMHDQRSSLSKQCSGSARSPANKEAQGVPVTISTHYQDHSPTPSMKSSPGIQQAPKQERVSVNDRMAVLIQDNTTPAATKVDPSAAAMASEQRRLSASSKTQASVNAEVETVASSTRERLAVVGLSENPLGDSPREGDHPIRVVAPVMSDLASEPDEQELQEPMTTLRDDEQSQRDQSEESANAERVASPGVMSALTGTVSAGELHRSDKSGAAEIDQEGPPETASTGDSNKKIRKEKVSKRELRERSKSRTLWNKFLRQHSESGAGNANQAHIIGTPSDSSETSLETGKHSIPTWLQELRQDSPPPPPPPPLPKELLQPEEEEELLQQRWLASGPEATEDQAAVTNDSKHMQQQTQEQQRWLASARQYESQYQHQGSDNPEETSLNRGIHDNRNVSSRSPVSSGIRDTGMSGSPAVASKTGMRERFRQFASTTRSLVGSLGGGGDGSGAGGNSVRPFPTSVVPDENEMEVIVIENSDEVRSASVNHQDDRRLTRLRAASSRRRKQGPLSCFPDGHATDDSSSDPCACNTDHGADVRSLNSLLLFEPPLLNYFCGANQKPDVVNVPGLQTVSCLPYACDDDGLSGIEAAGEDEGDEGLELPLSTLTSSNRTSSGDELARTGSDSSNAAKSDECVGGKRDVMPWAESHHREVKTTLDSASQANHLAIEVPNGLDAVVIRTSDEGDDQDDDIRSSPLEAAQEKESEPKEEHHTRSHPLYQPVVVDILGQPSWVSDDNSRQPVHSPDPAKDMAIEVPDIVIRTSGEGNDDGDVRASLLEAAPAKESDEKQESQERSHPLYLPVVVDILGQPSWISDDTARKRVQSPDAANGMAEDAIEVADESYPGELQELQVVERDLETEYMPFSGFSGLWMGCCAPMSNEDLLASTSVPATRSITSEGASPPTEQAVSVGLPSAAANDSDGQREQRYVESKPVERTDKVLLSFSRFRRDPPPPSVEEEQEAVLVSQENSVGKSRRKQVKQAVASAWAKRKAKFAQASVKATKEPTLVEC